jgi:hypothetical protein
MPDLWVPIEASPICHRFGALLTVNTAETIALNDWMIVNNDLERMLKEAVVASFRIRESVCLVRLSLAIKYTRMHSPCFSILLVQVKGKVVPVLD